MMLAPSNAAAHWPDLLAAGFVFVGGDIILGHLIPRCKGEPPTLMTVTGRPSEVWARLMQAEQRHPGAVERGRLLGAIERLLFLYCFRLDLVSLVVAWLALKVAAKWESAKVIALPEHLPLVDEGAYLIARREWGQQRLMSFLLGTAANVLVAAAADACVRIVT